MAHSDTSLSNWNVLRELPLHQTKGVQEPSRPNIDKADNKPAHDTVNGQFDPYWALSELLNEVQVALGKPPSDEPENLKTMVERIDRAAEMRKRLWNAIARYRDDWAGKARP